MTDKPRITVMPDEQGRVIVADPQDIAQALAAGYQPHQLAFAVPDTTVNTEAAVSAALAHAEALHAADRNAWEAERIRLVDQAIKGVLPAHEASIRAAERTRVMDIQSLTKAGLQGVAQDAIEKGMTVEAFALAQLRTMEDRGITLDAILNDSPSAAAHAAPPANEAKASAKSSWAHTIKKFQA